MRRRVSIWMAVVLVIPLLCAQRFFAAPAERRAPRPTPAPFAAAKPARSSTAVRNTPSEIPSAERRQVEQNYARLPLQFEANQGQTAKEVKFLARGKGYELFLTQTESVLALLRPTPAEGRTARPLNRNRTETTIVRMELLGANPRAKVAGVDELPGKTSYFIGNDPKKWRTNVSNYATVEYKGVYPGIDLLYYGNQRRMEYDFVVAPGADPKAIAFGVKGADKIQLEKSGDLLLSVAGGELRLKKPFIYQEIEGRRKMIAGNFRLTGKNKIGISLGNYDRSRPLIIDPVLVYSTYLGGSGDENMGVFGAAGTIVVDPNQNAYVAGITLSQDFPQIAVGIDTTCRASQPCFSQHDIFVVKLDPTGAAILATYFIGGNGGEFLGGEEGGGGGLAIDTAGTSLYLAGYTYSSDFPTTVGAYDRTLNGPYDAFVARIDLATPALAYGTYLGGSNNDRAADVKVDGSGNAYVVGNTDSSNFPTTVGAFQTTPGQHGDSFVTKINAAGSGLVFSTYLAGDDLEEATRLALDSSGNAYVAGLTFSRDFPTTPGSFSPIPGNGGVYKTTDGAATWAQSTAGLTDPRVLALVVAPTAPLFLYAGTPTGVFVSTDGGASWAASQNGIGTPVVHSLAVDPSNQNIVYAGTDGGGVFKTTDGGGTWNPSNSGLTGPVVLALAIDPTTPQHLLAGTQSGIFISTDSGATWTGAIGSGFGSVYSFAFHPVSPTIVFAGTDMGVYKSTDGGASWSASTAGLAGPPVQSLAIDPSNANRIFAGTELSGVYRSDDGGVNWVQSNNDGINLSGLEFQDVTTVVIDPANPAIVYAGTDGAGVFSSLNGGTNWQPAANGISTFVNVFAMHPVNPSIIFAGTTFQDAFVTKLDASGGSLGYSTFLGGWGDDIVYGIAVSSSDEAYVVGETTSINFPVLGALQASGLGRREAFVTRLNSNGNPIFSTYFSGSGNDAASDVVIESSQNAIWIVGSTDSPDLPILLPLRAALSGSMDCNGSPCSDLFVAKIDNTPALLFSTYLGGSRADQATGVALDNAGNVFITGRTFSSDFPLVSALQANLQGTSDAFVLKLADNAIYADLSISGSHTPEPVIFGNNVTFNITVTNNGPDPATGVTMFSTLSYSTVDINIISAVPSQGTCVTFPEFRCDLGTLANGATATITVDGSPAGPGLFSGALSVGANESDPLHTNNAITENVTILPGADLVLFAYATPNPVIFGNNATFSIYVVNKGTSDATGVTLTNVLPLGLGFVSANTSQGTCSFSGSVSCAIGTMASAGYVTVTVVVAPTAVGFYTSPASVSGNETEFNTSDNSASAFLTVLDSTAAEQFLLTKSHFSGFQAFQVSTQNLSSPYPTGATPAGMAVLPGGRVALVGNADSNYISVVDLPTFVEIRRIQGVQAAWHLVLTPDGSKLVVPIQDQDEVAVIDTSSFSEIGRVSFNGLLGDSPLDPTDIKLGAVVIVGDLAFVNSSHRSPGNLAVGKLDLATMTASQFVSGLAGQGTERNSIAATPDGQHLVVLRSAQVYTIDIAAASVVNTQSPTCAPSAVAVVRDPNDPDGVFGYLACGSEVRFIDLQSGSPNFGQVSATGASIPSPGRDIALSADGNTAVVVSGVAQVSNLFVLDANLVRNNPGSALLNQLRVGNQEESLSSASAEVISSTLPPPTAPIVSTLSTSQIVAGTQQTIHIGGSNFGTGALVRIGNLDPIPATNVSSSDLDVLVPASVPASKAVPIVVTNPNLGSPISDRHQSGVLFGALDILPPPTYLPANKVLVSHFGDSSFGALDTAPREFTAQSLIGARGMGTAVTPNGQYAYVSVVRPPSVHVYKLSNFSLENVVSPSALEIGEIDSVKVAPHPTTGNPTAYVSTREALGGGQADYRVFLIDADSTSPNFNTLIDSFSMGVTDSVEPGAIAIKSDGSFAYGSDGLRLFAIDLVNRVTAPLVPAGLNLEFPQAHMFLTPNGELLVRKQTGEIAVLDTTPDPFNPTLIAILTATPPAGVTSAFLSDFLVQGNHVYAFDVVRHVVYAFNFNRGTSNFSQVAAFQIPAHQNLYDASISISPDGSRLYVPLQEDDSVAVIQTQSLLLGNPNPVETRLRVGLLPVGVAVSPQVSSAADVSVTATDSPDPVNHLSSFGYTVRVTNAGPSPASSVTLTANISGPASVSSVTPDQGICSSTAPYVCDLGAIAAMATVNVQFVLTATASGNPSIDVNVVAAEPDPNPYNNSATESTTVISGTTPPLVEPVQTSGTVPGLSNTFGAIDFSSSNQAGDVVFISGSSTGLFFRPASTGVITRILQTGDPVPGFPGSRADIFNQAFVNGSGVVALAVELNLGSGATTERAILTWNSSTSTFQTVVFSRDAAQGLIGAVYGRDLRLGGINDSGDVAFTAPRVPSGSTAPAQNTLYIALGGGTPSYVIGEGDLAPSTAAAITGISFLVFNENMLRNSSGIVFRAGLAGGGEGLFTATTGGAVKRVVSGDSKPTGGTFSTFGKANLNDAGQTIFVADNAVWQEAGGIARLFGVGDAAPASVGGSISSLITSALTVLPINSTGMVLVPVNISGGSTNSALVRFNGTALEAVAYGGQAAPGAGGTFSSFFQSALSINTSGSVAFVANIAGGTAPRAIFTQTSTNPSVLVELENNPLPSSSGFIGLRFTNFIRFLDSGNLQFPVDVLSGTGFYALLNHLSGVSTELMSTQNALPVGANTVLRTININGAPDFLAFRASHAGGRLAIAVRQLSLATEIIVQDGYPTPGGVGGQLRLMSVNYLPINRSGKIAFLARMIGGSRYGATGIFGGTYPSGTFSYVITGDSEPTSGSTFASFPSSFTQPTRLNSNGQLAFAATLANGQSGIFVSDGTAITTIVLSGFFAPITGTFGQFSLFTQVAISDSGRGVFFGNTVGGPTEGIYSFTPFGGIYQVVAEGDLLFGRTVQSVTTTFDLSNRDELVFGALHQGGGGGYYVASVFGNVQEIARSGDPAPSGGTFTNIGGSADILINDRGDAAFRADIAGGLGASGYFVRRFQPGVSPYSAPIEIAREGQTAPGVSAPIVLFPAGSFQIAPNGDVAFGALLGTPGGNNVGIFRFRADNVLEKIMIRGDFPPGTGGGKMLSNGFLRAIDSGRFAFWAGLSGGTDTDIIYVTNSQQQADISVSVAVSQNPATVGVPFTITATVVNFGPNTANSVIVNASGEGVNLNLNSIVPSQGTCAMGFDAPVCDLGSIPSGQTATIVFDVTATGPGAMTVFAQALAHEGDPDVSDNIGSAFLTVSAPGVDLAVALTDSPDPVAIGQNLTYQITVSNNGTNPAANVTLTDILPSGVNFVSATPSQGTCSGTTTVTCDLGTLAAAAAATVDIVVSPTSAGSLSNSVSATTTDTDANPANNSATISTSVTFAACTISFDNSTGNSLWQDLLNWDLDRLPGVSDDVCIGAGFNVTLSSGTQTINTLSSFSPLTFSSGTLDIAAASGMLGAPFTQSGGTLTGAGTLTVSGLFTWTGGTQSGTGTTNAAAGMDLLSGVVFVGNRVLNTAGNSVWSAGNVQGGQSSVWNNSGTLNVTGDNIISSAFGGPGTVFTNTGTVTKMTGAGTTSWGVAFNNHGTLNVNSGTLDLSSGGTSSGAFNVATTLEFSASHTLSGTSSVSGAGTVQLTVGTVDVDGSYNITGGTSFSGGTGNFNPASTVSSVGALSLTSGTANFSSGNTIIPTNAVTQSGGTLTGSDVVQLNALFTWTGGTQSGTGTTNAAAGMDLLSGVVFVGNRVLNTAGASVWSAGNVQGGQSSVWNNSGMLDVTGDNIISNAFGGTTVFTNTGTVTKMTGVGTTSWGVAFNNHGTLNVNSGTLDLQSGGTSTGSFQAAPGATLWFSGGAQNITLGPANSITSTGTGTVQFGGSAVNTTIGGSGTYNVTNTALVISGIVNFNLPNATTAQFSQSGGTLSGIGTLTISTSGIWSGGVMEGGGTLVVAPGATLDIVANVGFHNHILTNNGTFRMISGNSWTSGAGGVINNQAGATFDLQTDLTILFNQGGSPLTINNSGLFLKSAGSGTANLNAVLNGSGTVAAQSGTLKLSMGGTSNGNFNVTSSPTAVLEFQSGTFDLMGATLTASTGNFLLSGATITSGALLTINGAFQFTSGTITGGGSVNFNGPVQWSGGSMTGAGGTVIFSTGSLNVTGPVSLAGRSLNNFGTVTLNGDINHGSAVIVNQSTALFDITSNAGLNFTLGGTLTQFSNSGTFRKSSGSASSLVDVNFQNFGNALANSGTLNFTNFTQFSGGQTVLNGGSISSAGTMNFNRGVLAGNGAVNANISLDGTISPGLSVGSAGQLSINGSLAMQSNALFEAELGGLGAGTQFDRLQVTGAATLDGTLNISTFGGFAPLAGNAFQIIAYASSSGAFATINGLSQGGVTLLPNQNPTDFTLFAQGPPATVDLGLIKVGSPDPVVVDNMLSYTLTLTNTGAGPASGVTLTDTLDASVAFFSATATQGTCSFSAPITVTCNLGSLNVGGSITVTIVATPTSAGSFNNSASVTSVETDSNTANNTALFTSQVNAAACILCATGLVDWYRGELTAKDSYGTVHGTLQNGVAFTAGKVGQAFSFDGVDDQITTSATPVLTQQPITMMAWVRPQLRTDGTSFPSNAISNDDPGLGGQGFGVNVFSGGSEMRVEERAAGPIRLIPGVSFQANRWYHVAVVFTSGNTQTFVDGVLVDNFNFTPLAAAGFNFIRIGFHNDDAGTYGTRRFFKGEIDEVQVFGRTLSPAEIQGIYNASVKGNCQFDAAIDFSASSNPTGAWSYGFSPTRGGIFTLYSNPAILLGALDTWNDGVTIDPNVSHNPTANAFVASTMDVQPSQLTFHPGQGGVNSVVRWTAPAAGFYRVTAYFRGADTFGTTTDVAALQNSGLLFAGVINGFNDTEFFGSVISAQAGDTVDFTVGFGQDSAPFFDSTALDVQITPLTTAPPPLIFSITPNTGPAAGGTPVTLSGQNFQSGATVSFGANPAASVVVVNSSTITAVSPVGTGTVGVTVANPDAQSATLVGGFTYTGGLADLTLAKTDSPDPVFVGNNLTYTLAVTNNGPNSATSVTLTDSLPGSMTFVSATPSQGTCSGTITVTCSLGTLVNAATATVNIVVTPTGASALLNTASVSATEADPNPADNSANTTTTSVAGPDVSVSVADSPDPASFAGNVNYGVSVTNNGPTVASGVVLAYTVPANVVFANASASQGGCSFTAPNLTCDLGTISQSSTASVSVTVAPQPALGGTMSATFTATLNEPDPTPSNNTASATTTFVADISVSVADSPDPASFAGNVNYGVSVTNNGPTVASGVVLAYTVPANVVFANASASQGNCSFTAPTLTCNLGTISQGSTASVSVNVTPQPALGGTMSATFTATLNEPDPTPSNNTASATTTFVGDVTVAVTDTPDPASFAGNVNYGVSVTNNGPTVASGVVLAYTIPANVVFANASASQGNCSFTAPTLTCNLGTISQSSTASVSVVVTPQPALGSTLNATFTATLNEPDATPSDNIANVTTTFSADLSITGSDSPDPVVPGNNVTYSLTATNVGPSAASGVVLSYNLPANVSFINASSSQGNCSFSSPALACNLGNINASGSASVSLVVQPSLAVGANLSGTINVVANEPDPNTANNSITLGTTLSISDLSISIADSPDPVNAGSNLTYTLNIVNSGPTPATNVTLTDTLPAGVTFVSSTPSQGSCSGTTTVTCNLGTVGISASASVTILVNAPTPGTLSNTASISATETDPNPADNSATASTTVNATVDLAPTVTDAPDPVNAGGNISYTVTIPNPGAFDALNVTLADTLPASITFVSAAPSQGTCAAPAGNVLTCNLGTITGGSAATITIVVTANAASVPSVTNTVTVSTSSIDTNSANDTASEVTTVNPLADLSLTKADAPDPVTTGNNLTYTLAVANAGPSSASNVTLTDTLPAGVTFISTTPTQGTCSGTATVVCNLGTLASGATATVTIIIRPTAVGTLNNSASVAAAEPDPNAVNNVSAATTTVNPATADLALAMTDAPDPVPAGGNLSYTLTVTNSGPDTATNILLTDTLPAGVNFVAANATQGSCTGTAPVTCNLIALLSGSSATVTIVVTPPTVGSLNNAASVTANELDPNAANNSAAQTTTVISGPAVSLSTNVLNFASQPVGTTSTPQTVTLTNGGNSPLNISSIVVAGDFTQSNTCGTSIAPSSSCFLSVTFAPTSAGTLSGSITITHNAPGGSSVISLVGSGVNAPAISLSATSLVFGSRPIGSASPPQSITLSNTGSATLNIQSIAISSSDFAQTNNCAATVAVGSSCVIDVTFVPAGSGLRTGGVTITSDARGSVPVITLTGFGVAQGVTLSSSVLVFSSQLVASTSAPQTITLTNNGGPLTIASIAVTGDFAQTNNCTSPVASGAACTLSVTFAPSQAGSLGGSLTITDDGVGSPRLVSLSGTGVTATVSVSPLNLTFAGQTLATTSPAQSITYSNTGGSAVSITSIQASGAFAQTNNCGASLATGASCTMNVTFTPNSPGILTGALTITDNAVGSPHIVTLTGTGIATGPAANLSTTSVTFAAQIVGTTSTAQQVTLTNAGNSALNITSIQASGDFGQSNNCGTSLNSGASCVISITFTPTLTGPRAGSVNIVDNSPTSPEVINLSGQGLPSGAAVTLSTNGLAFSNQDVNTSSAPQTVTLTNSGNALLSIAGITVTGDYSQTNTCGASVNAAASCTISVTFRPTATGTRNGGLTITDNAAGSPRSVALVGNGTSFTITPSPGGPTTVTINPGQSAAFDFNLSPSAGYTGIVTLSCSGLPAGSACVFSQNPVTVTAPVTVHVTITTTAPSGGMVLRLPPSLSPFDSRPILVVLTVLLMLAAMVQLAKAKRRRNALAFALLLCLAVLGSACAGGITAPAPVGRTPGTPAGSYTVTLTATSSSGHSQSSSVTVVVR